MKKEFTTSYKGFTDLNYVPDKDNDLVATFYMEPEPPKSFEEVAEAVAGESSIGTWTNLETLSQETKAKLSPKIFKVDKKRKFIKIAYPIDLFEKGNISQILSSIGGNIFSMKIIKLLRLENIEMPKSLAESFPGPALGLSGVRKIVNIFDRPLLGSIIKPKVGLSPQETADLAKTVWENGVDVIKDDENLTSMTFNNFQERAKLILEAKKEVEDKTGDKKIFVFNVSAPADLMLERANFIKKLGGKCVMVDVVSCGISAVQFLRNQDLGLILHGHRAGHSTFTRIPTHGISMLVLSKLYRLAGIDQLHTGTVVGKMEGDRHEVKTINDFLRSPFYNIKEVMPIASGGLHPGLLDELVRILGNDLIINFGGGLHGHPGGSAAGAKAVRQAIEAIKENISLEEASKDNQELKAALDYWKNVKN